MGDKPAGNPTTSTQTNEKNWETNERKWETSRPGTRPDHPAPRRPFFKALRTPNTKLFGENAGSIELRLRVAHAIVIANHSITTQKSLVKTAGLAGAAAKELALQSEPPLQTLHIARFFDLMEGHCHGGDSIEKGPAV